MSVSLSFSRSPLALSITLALASAAHAQGLVAPQPLSQDDSALTLGTISITSKASGPLPTRSVFSSVDIVGADILENEHVDYSWELLSKAPGVQVTQFKQGTDAGRFSFRGFNGEGRINAVKLLIDGIPSNDNAGGMPFLDAVFPLDIEAIEIVRGTNDARYGLNNIAGNANVITRTGGNEGRASVTVGSFGTKEFQVSKGIESGNWSQNYFLAWRDSDGYRDHADARKLSLSGKWFYTSDDGRWRTGVIALLPQQGAGVGLPQLRRSHQGAAQLPGLRGGRPWRAGNRPAQRPPGWRTDARAVAVRQGLRQPVREPALGALLGSGIAAGALQRRAAARRHHHPDLAPQGGLGA